MQHLNPQLQTLMKDKDSKGSQYLLFRENFGEKAKSKIEAAAAVVTPSGDKGNLKGFTKATLKETAGPARVASPNTMAQQTNQGKRQ